MLGYGSPSEGYGSLSEGYGSAEGYGSRSDGSAEGYGSRFRGTVEARVTVVAGGKGKTSLIAAYLASQHWREEREREKIGERMKNGPTADEGLFYRQSAKCTSISIREDSTSSYGDARRRGRQFAIRRITVINMISNCKLPVFPRPIQVICVSRSFCVLHLSECL